MTLIFTFQYGRLKTNDEEFEQIFKGTFTFQYGRLKTKKYLTPHNIDNPIYIPIW